MKKIVALILSLTLVLAVGIFAACSKETPVSNADPSVFPEGAEIAVPSDPTNEARALIILENLGLIKLSENAGITATIRDITENPHNITFREVEAAQIPNILQDVDYGVINSNYAIGAGLKPTKDALALEGSYSAYSNILAVKAGNETAPLTLALIAALESKEVSDFIADTYDGAVLSVVENPGDGYHPDVDYAALAGQTITVAASPTPHAEILAVAKNILAQKDITLEVIEYDDYVVPNQVVDSGEVYANFFQHTPYLHNFNEENGTNVVEVFSVHVEPMGVYGGKQSALTVGK